MELIKHHSVNSVFFLLLGFVLGAVSVLGVRYYNSSADHTHYHAAFGIYLEGERQMFTEPGFYEEVNACSTVDSDPAQRVHMHEPDNDVIHVHDNLATWGDFFENIGFSISDRHIKTNSRMHLDGPRSPITYLLNGEEVRNPANTLIGDEDVLLISYGESTESVLNQQLDSIKAEKAAQANHQDDPGSCGGAVNDWRHTLGDLF